MDPMAAVSLTGAQTLGGPQDADQDVGVQLETLFTKLLLTEVRKSMPKDGGMFGGQSAQMYGDMFDQAIAESIGKSGGLGLAKQLALGEAGDIQALQASLGRMRPSQALSRFTGHRTSGDMPVQGTLSSSFGHRADPLHGGRKHHAGLDIAARRGTPIETVSSGVVRYAGERGGYGNMVIVDHPDGTETRYAHMDRIDVKAGEAVSRRDQIGTVGSTGRSTGPHLHFEVRQDGRAIDPMKHFGWPR